NGFRLNAMTEPDVSPPDDTGDARDVCICAPSMEDLVLEDTTIDKTSGDSRREESVNDDTCDNQTENESRTAMTDENGKNERMPLTFPEVEESTGSLDGEYKMEDDAIDKKDSHDSLPQCKSEVTFQSEESAVDENSGRNPPSSVIPRRPLIGGEYPIECKRLKVDPDEVENPEEPEETDEQRKQAEQNEIVQRLAKEFVERGRSRGRVPEHLLKLADNQRTGAVAIRINGDVLDGRQFMSKVVTVLALRWCLMTRLEGEYVSLYLQCLETDDFRCLASNITYKMHHPTDSKQDLERIVEHHEFTGEENDWGYKHFMRKSKLSELYHCDDSLLFSCVFHLDYPQGIRFLDDKTRFPIGLANQGATCYMNAALQILFSTKCLRKAILEVDFKEEDSGVVKSLQKLFYRMHTSIKGLSTNELTDAFGWKNTEDSFTQHDVQEMMKILLDKIEIAFRGTQFKNLVDDLFKTRTKTFIRCLEVEFESGKEEYCLDIQLPVRSQDESDEPFDVLSALREVTKIEVMEGDNKYAADGHGLQRAQKGTKFVSFPKILHLQFLRFQMDWSGELVKVHDRIEYSDILDLSEFVDEDDDETVHEYALHGVVCHSGVATRGHYITYICNFPGADKPRWFRFDDSIVKECAKDDVINEEHFGIGSGDSFTAYMVTYIRTDVLREVLGDFPLSIVSRRLREEMDEKRRKKKSEKVESTMLSIRVIREHPNMSSCIWDHFDYRQYQADPYRIKLRGSDPAIKLFHNCEDLMEAPVRLFLMKKRMGKHEVWRVDNELEKGLVEMQMGSVESYLGEKGKEDFAIFIMTSTPLVLNEMRGMLDSRNKERDKIIFIKFYNGSCHTTLYVSPFIVPSYLLLSHICEYVCAAANLPRWSHIKFWKENSYDELEEIDGDLRPIEVEMGDIIVFELIHLIQLDKNIQSVLEDSRMVEVSFIPNQKLCYGLIKDDVNRVITITVSMTSTYRRLIGELSDALEHSAKEIIIWIDGVAVETDRLDEKVSCAVNELGLDEDPRGDTSMIMCFARLSVSCHESLLYMGIETTVRIEGKGHSSQTEYFEKARSKDLLNLFKKRIQEKYEMSGMERLRLVYRFRQGSGYYVFREIKPNEDLEDSLSYFPCATAGSLVICVDEMEDREMVPMDMHEYIIPLIHIHSRNVKNFNNKEKTLFIKVGYTDDVSTLKFNIEAKCREVPIDWTEVDLLAFMGSKWIDLEVRSSLDLDSVYAQLNEEPGVRDTRETRVFLALFHRTKRHEDERDNRSQSIIIRD
ncbi:hypothetical protein PENTCL1PPCAC_22944, partial [Pristionchus entomophagus]